MPFGHVAAEPIGFHPVGSAESREKRGTYARAQSTWCFCHSPKRGRSMMLRHKTAEAEIDEIINEADKERRRKRRYTSARCKKPTGPGEKCLYSWTCGPRNDGRCPYSSTCADWKRPLVHCAQCMFRSPTVDQNGRACVICCRCGDDGAIMPLDGYCSEGVLERFQDAARYLR